MIKLFNVRKNFPLNGSDIDILTNINLTINAGDIFGIIGKTGAGKSTLLRLINGFITPDAGEIYIEDRLLDKKSRPALVKQTSMIFQNYNLLANLTVLNNVLLPLKFRKLKTKSYYDKALELLDFVGLSEQKDSYVRTLSGGQKQRVAIARALISRPDIILCDEPTSALDELTSYEVLRLLQMINERYQTTIVLVSHNIDIIKMMCNKVAVIEAGTIKDIITRTPAPLKVLTYAEALLND